MKASRGATAKARPKIDSEEEQRKIISMSHAVVVASMFLLYPQALVRIVEKHVLASDDGVG